MAARFHFCLGAALLVATPALAQPAAPDTARARLHLEKLPDAALADDKIARNLDQLSRERCDRAAIRPLAANLAAAGYRREAANALVAFADTCGGGEDLLYQAVGYLYVLSDYPAVVALADRLVALASEKPGYRYVRGQAYEAMGKYPEALADFNATVSLANDVRLVAGPVFRHLSNVYAKEGRYCEAMEAIQTFVRVDPAKRDNPQAQALIADLSSKIADKNACGTVATAAGSDTFPKFGPGTIRTRATIDGVEGTFIVDTGATYVTLTEDFAKRANVATVPPRKIKLQSANGPIEALLGTIPSVKLGKVEATNVVAAVTGQMPQPFGARVDGLLGQSFLSRFDVTFGVHEWKIAPRAGR